MVFEIHCISNLMKSLYLYIVFIYENEPQHEIFNNVVCATSIRAV